MQFKCILLCLLTNQCTHSPNIKSQMWTPFSVKKNKENNPRYVLLIFQSCLGCLRLHRQELESPDQSFLRWISRNGVNVYTVLWRLVLQCRASERHTSCTMSVYTGFLLPNKCHQNMTSARVCVPFIKRKKYVTETEQWVRSSCSDLIYINLRCSRRFLLDPPSPVFLESGRSLNLVWMNGNPVSTRSNVPAL